VESIELIVLLWQLFVVTVTVPSCVMNKMVLSPTSRVTELENHLSAVKTRATGPCGGFTAAYKCACDFHDIEFVDEVAWVRDDDVCDVIYIQYFQFNTAETELSFLRKFFSLIHNCYIFFFCF